MTGIYEKEIADGNIQPYAHANRGVRDAISNIFEICKIIREKVYNFVNRNEGAKGQPRRK